MSDSYECGVIFILSFFAFSLLRCIYGVIMSDWYEWAVICILSFFAFSLLLCIYEFLKSKGAKNC